ncbi:hypothetical protein CVT25_008491 [Psilocybe cyanescens]|uniref:Uncharacterized protein n=1 Tax=Psilocybe cyanescens TaxID=93625 RepID=A0A409XRX2_PSICY|nr:hypothetical protein CVT25_008491 [Psilocybe cyanescens]
MPTSSPELMSDTNHSQSQKCRLGHAFDQPCSKKRRLFKSENIFENWSRFAAWKTRNGKIDIDWAEVLDKGIMWDSGSYGGQPRCKFREENCAVLEIFIETKKQVVSFEDDMQFFTSSSDRLDNLAKAMNQAAGNACSNDISSLKKEVLEYTTVCMPDNKLNPPILHCDFKAERGFVDVQFAHLLCLIKNCDAFDSNPEG